MKTRMMNASPGQYSVSARALTWPWPCCRPCLQSAQSLPQCRICDHVTRSSCVSHNLVFVFVGNRTLFCRYYTREWAFRIFQGVYHCTMFGVFWYVLASRFVLLLLMFFSGLLPSLRASRSSNYSNVYALRTTATQLRLRQTQRMMTSRDRTFLRCHSHVQFDWNCFVSWRGNRCCTQVPLFFNQ